MTSFFITTTARDTPWYPWAHANYVRVLRAAESTFSTKYNIAEHPKNADIIVFVEPQRRFQTDIRNSSLFKEYAQKSVVLDFFDNPIPLVPGLYVGLQHRDANALYQSGFYIRVADNSMLDSTTVSTVDPDLLFSFIGKVSNNGAVREKVLRLQHARAYLRDQSSNQSDNDQDYVDVIRRSKFVLAPRGLGVSSWRLFETLKAGRVPVIISDDWVEPKGIDWSAVSVRVRESDIWQIPQILEALEPDSARMGLNARRTWKRCFSSVHSFSWIAERLEEIQSQRSLPGVELQHDFSKLFMRENLKQKIAYVRERIGPRFGINQ